MALYKYKAVQPGKAVAEVVIEADSEADSLTRLRRRGLSPVKFLGDVGEKARGFQLTAGSGFNVNEFTDQLVPLLEANIPLERALSIIEESSATEGSRKIARSLRQGLHEGKRFSELIRKQGNRFPPIYASLIETGEETGCLPEVAKELQRFLHESRDLKEFIVTSSIYPVIVITIVLGVIILLFTVFIPQFSKIFKEMGRDLPLLTKIMLEIGNVMKACWWIWPLLITGGITFRKVLSRNGAVKQWWDKVVLGIPVFGGIVKSIQISRFIRTLSIMIKNHVHLLSAVKISEKVIMNTKIAGTLAGTEADLRGGAKLSGALAKSPYMPPGSSAMLRISEESGNAGEMLERIAEESERKIRIKIKRLLALMEPVIILILALIVLAVVLSVFLAVMEMNAI